MTLNLASSLLFTCIFVAVSVIQVCVFVSFYNLGTQKWQANQPCGIMATSKGILGHNLLNFRVKAWVKLWVRLRITQAVVMVMVWEHLQAVNASGCNVLTSDENKVRACAACLPIEFLYPVLYNISRPHWFWNKHLPSRELGPPAKFVWSVCSRFLCLRWKYWLAPPSGRLLRALFSFSDGKRSSEHISYLIKTHRNTRTACDTFKSSFTSAKVWVWCFQSAAIPPWMLATSQQEMTGAMRYDIPAFYRASILEIRCSLRCYGHVFLIRSAQKHKK